MNFIDIATGTQEVEAVQIQKQLNVYYPQWFVDAQAKGDIKVNKDERTFSITPYGQEIKAYINDFILMKPNGTFEVMSPAQFRETYERKEDRRATEEKARVMREYLKPRQTD